MSCARYTIAHSNAGQFTTLQRCAVRSQASSWRHLCHFSPSTEVYACIAFIAAWNDEDVVLVACADNNVSWAGMCHRDWVVTDVFEWWLGVVIAFDFIQTPAFCLDSTAIFCGYDNSSHAKFDICGENWVSIRVTSSGCQVNKLPPK